MEMIARRKYTEIASFVGFILCLLCARTFAGDLRISGPGDSTWLILTPNGHLRASAPIKENSLPGETPPSGAFQISREGDTKAALSGAGLQLKDELVPTSTVNTSGELSFSTDNASPPPPQAVLGGAHPETDGKLYLAGMEAAPGVPVRSVAYVDDFAVYEQRDIGDTLHFAYANITGLGGVAGRTIYDGDVTANYYYIKDHLGSTRMVVDEEITVVEATAYLAYGSIIDVGPQSPVDGAREKFTGKEFDTEGSVNGAPGIRLDYFGKRYYDPSIGVWTSVDPAQEVWSSYAAFRLGPTVWVDPDGAKNDWYLVVKTEKAPKNLKKGLQSRLKLNNVKMRVKQRKTEPKRLHATDVVTVITEQPQAPDVEVRGLVRATGYTVSLGTQRAWVFADKTQPIGFAQTLKATLHEGGHALFSFEDNTGGVMGQGNYKNTGLDFTKEQRLQIERFLHENR